MKLSVIIPVYNGELTIQRALDSLRRQSEPPFETIVVDNGSSDGTAEIIRRNGITPIHCPVRGRSRARNSGATRASGDYLVFIDADVELADDWLSQLRGFLQEVNVDVAATAVIPRSKDVNSVLDRFRYSLSEIRSHGTFLSLRKYFGYLPVINSAAFAIRRKTFEECGGFDENMIRSEDMELSLRLYHSGKVLGGTMRCRSFVSFESRFRTLSYLARNFERARLASKREWPYGKASRMLAKKFLRNREWRLFLFLLLLEVFQAAGFLFFRKKTWSSLAWKQQTLSPKMTFSFASSSNLYLIRPHFRFFFIDQSVVKIDKEYRWELLEAPVAAELRELLAGRTGDARILKETDMFYEVS